MKDWTYLLTDVEKTNVEEIITKLDLETRPTLNEFLTSMIKLRNANKLTPQN